MHEVWPRVRDCYRRFGWPGGNALILPGPGAPELPELINVLNWRADRIWAVDKLPGPVLDAKRQLPEVSAHRGLLHQVFKQHRPPIGFAHLDFMSSLNETDANGLRAIRGLILPRAIVLVTFFMAHKLPEKVLFYAGRKSAPKDLEERKVVRFAGSIELVRQALSRPRMELLFTDSYNSPAPMGIIAFRASDG